MQNISDDTGVLPALKGHVNTFLTGSAGSGKTYLASHFCETLPNAVLTATTGVAALNIGGETIHRFLGLGITTRQEQVGKIMARWEKIKQSSAPWDVSRWQTIKQLGTLIVDEVSMLRRDQFELVDIVLSYVKDNPLPFGGVQVVLVGDFFQLPPVVTEHDAFTFKDLKDPYCFQSQIWSQANLQSFNLTSNYRQGEGEFLEALEKLRVGNVTKEIEDLLASRVNAKLNIPMQPVKLFSLKDTVHKENIECLKQLPGDKYVSEAEFEGKEYDINILKKECPAEVSLYFGKGAQVMMLTNDPSNRWVNGTMGIIRSNSPLTIQLSSGLTVPIDMHTWERTVPFTDSSGDIKAKVLAKMKQYPFKLAYATTIHRSQGLTLDYIDIDLTNCFAPGQAYVALSRAKTIEGLTLRGWNKNSVKTDKRVLKFYGL